MKIVVCVHIYYIEQLEYIFKKLKNLSFSYRLVITTPHKKELAEIKSTFNKLNVEMEVILVENIGMDVFPFLTALSKIKLNDNDIVCKVHTKNTKSDVRRTQRDLLFGSVLPNRDSLKCIIKEFEQNNELDYVGSGILFRSVDALMYGNKKYYSELRSNIYQSKDSNAGFFAGTMFWVRVRALRAIIDAYDYIHQKVRESSQIYKTGADGSYIHALERIFNVNFDDINRKIRFFDTIISDKTYYYGIQHTEKFVLDTVQSINKARNLSYNRSLIKDNKALDENYYTEKYKIPDVETINFYILIGEEIGHKPNKEFDPKCYYLLYPEIYESKYSALCHYLVAGKSENRISNFDDFDQGIFFLNNNLFSSYSYEKIYGRLLKENAREEFKYFAKPLDRYPSLPVKKFFSEKSIKEFVKENGWSHFHEFKLLQRIFLSGNYENSLVIAKRLYQTSIPSLNVIYYLAASLFRLNQYDKSRYYWEEYFSLAKEEALPGGAKSKYSDPILPPDFISIYYNKNKKYKSFLNSNKVAVYTTLFGGFDDLAPVEKIHENIDFICFSDSPVESSGWTNIVVEPNFADSNRSAKIFKVLPHRFLASYDHSLFIDANTVVTGDLSLLIDKLLYDQKFSMWQHPERQDVFEEAEYIIKIFRHEPSPILEQVEHYYNSGLPNHTGLVEGSFIWRKHNDKSVRDFSESWWQQIQQFSKRDQLSLGYLLWRLNFRPTIIDSKLGTSRKNSFFEKISHKKKHFYLEGTSPEDQLYSEKSSNNSLRKLVFVYDADHVETGSTVMRGFQLPRIIRDYLPETLSIEVRPLLDFYNSVLFLTKGVLKNISIDRLIELKEKGNTLLFDFVDDIPDSAKVEFADVLIASSVSAQLHNCKMYPGIKSRLVTHHVDPRIRNLGVKSFSSIKIGYLGEIVNTVRTTGISNFVEFVGVDTSSQSNDWINRANDFNLHYAIRRTRGIDGYKPFLKGFTAACLRSNIIIQRDQVEALYYLTDDYPYLYDGSNDPQEIFDFISKAQSSFNSPEWNYGLEIMERVNFRCSDSKIASEIEVILEELGC